MSLKLYSSEKHFSWIFFLFGWCFVFFVLKIYRRQSWWHICAYVVWSAYNLRSKTLIYLYACGTFHVVMLLLAYLLEGSWVYGMYKMYT